MRIRYIFMALGIGLGIATMDARVSHKSEARRLTNMSDNIGYLANNLPPQDFDEIRRRVSCSIFNPTCSPVSEPINWQKVANAVKGRVSGVSKKVAAKNALNQLM